MALHSRHSKKLYYPAGIISLILLPVLCVWYFNRHHAFEQLHVVSVTWPPRSGHFFEDEDYLDRDYTHFNLTGDNQQNDIEIKRSKMQLRELIDSKDTMHGVHFHFADNTQFQQWIKVYDVCKTAKANVFIVHNNGIWIFNPRPAKLVKDDLMFCRGVICGGDCVQDTQQDIIDRIEFERAAQMHYIYKTIQTYSVSILLFIVMILLTVIKYSNRKPLLN